MHPEDIKAELRKRGWNGAKIGQKLGVSRHCVSAVIRGRSRSAMVEKEIATILEKPLYIVFPAYYSCQPPSD
ncbi:MULTISPECIES: helix-turn-helix domain-containing protein [unclassified Thermosynechococcus]|uniref:helix-turn-helix domain-containing protein n=1 Tax=unclassified Thermosynechococcus TaxID=2622553 RepID=UPI0019E872C0|nr:MULTISPECIES: helix-turn-helix domain-containing protein [unclassified Thermosynechococcus]HIK35677.1 helix-turn-helix domain-containing protein [Thermosynechococcus sp. M98_K2018_005]HIK48515.1 helix-turn-helix domain-containing protein [Thermosynechococcus sp. M55_K2018_012]